MIPVFFLANRIYVKDGVQVKPEFDEITKRAFGTETQTLDFKKPAEAGKVINDWIEAQTNHKIKNVLTPDSLTDSTSMVLVNAIYFMGNWKYKFNPQNTIKYSFYNAVASTAKNNTVKVDMMLLKKDLNYTALPELDAAAVQLPYKNSDISMMIILPNSLMGLPLLEKRLKTISFEGIVKKMELFPVTLNLPKFKVETKVELGNALKAVSRSTKSQKFD